MTDIYEYISKKIRDLRGDISQEVLSQRLKVAPNKLSRWETGTYKPTAEDLDLIAREFKVPISVFFPDHEEDERVAALTSATGGLSETDFNEVLNYARFRKAKFAMQPEKKKKQSK